MRAIFLLVLWFLSLTHASAREKVSVQLKWHHQFQFAGYYAALEKGFYRDEGLDVTLKDRELSKNNVDQVLAGESEYGIADSVLFVYQARKEPVVIVAPIFQHSPNVLITLKSSGIDSPYKLIGKKIALYPNDADGLPILAMLYETGVLKKGFSRINIPFDIHSLIRQKVDAHHGYVTNEPFVLSQNGIETNIINPQHFGVDLYGDMLFTSQKELRDHPKRVAAMKRATLRGWEYALKHKEEIIALIRTKYAPDKTLDQLRYEAEGIASVIDPATITVGTLDHGRFEYIQNLLHRHGLIGSIVPLGQYLYKDASSSSLDLTPQEREWLRTHPIVKTAIDTSWAPFEYLDEQGNYRGLAADYLALISQKLGIRFEPYKQGVWKDTVALMKQHQLDMYPCAVKTPERETYALFTAPYLSFRMVMATTDDVDYINDISELNHKTVAVARGYLAQEILRRYYPAIKRIEVDTVEEGLQAVATDKAFAFIDNTAAITYAIKQAGYSNLKISGELPYRSELAMGVRNDWPVFAGIIQKALASVTPEERDAIYNRHVAIKYTQPITWQWVLKIIFPFAIIVALLLYYTRKLRHLNRIYKMTMQHLTQTQNDLEEANTKLQTLSTTDALTGVFNRYMLDKTLLQSIESAKRYNRPLSVIMVDLDYFKEVNDTYGHHAGDDVLKASARLLSENCRKSDIVGRWGGEEFLIICPETSEAEAAALAEKLCAIFSHTPFLENHSQTASFGLSSYREDDTPETFVIRIDEALYDAKKSGRNCVRISLE